jgi:beta-galactosidase
MAQRTDILLNRNWMFRFSYQVQNGSGVQVNLPHTWNAGDALAAKPDYYRGMGNYTKKLHVPAEWKGKRLFLRFEGVNSVANLFVNQTHVGEHRGGYGAFVFDITDYVKYNADNILLVKVNNALQLDVMPLVGDFNFYGGIYRDVHLILTDPVHISLTDYASPGVYLIQDHVSKEQADVRARVVLSNHTDVVQAVRAQVTVRDGAKVVLQHSKELTIEGKATAIPEINLTLSKPHLWNGRKDPYIYKVEVKLLDKDGTALDSVEQPLGLRYFHVDADKGFFLNGEHLKLQGVCRHQDRAERGNALYLEHHDEDAAIIAEMGTNAIRLAHYPQADYFYGLMDKYGIVTWAEIPFIGPGGYQDRGFNDLPSFRENGRQQLIELIRQHYNHPSICFWGLFNELKTAGDNPTEYIRELNDLAHREDATRLTTAASFLGDGEVIGQITDLIAWNKYYGWYGGSFSDMGRWADNVHKNYPQYKIAVSEYGAGASIYHQQDSLKRVNATSYWHPENWQTAYHMGNWKVIAERPFIWGSFVWNMFDFGAAHRTEGDRPGINDKGLVTFDRTMKKDAFYFYKANWNKDEKFVYIAERRNVQRTHADTDITVFSNLSEVELIVNGRSLGKQKSDEYATFVWKSVRLTEGDNRIEARTSGGKQLYTDIVTWNLRD